MSKANARQVAGAHYQSALQHWDLIEMHGIGYLEGCATKYLTRWRKKNGRQDLEKAAHYIEKLLELHRDEHREARGFVPLNTLVEYKEANQLTDVEFSAIHYLTKKWTEEELTFALALTLKLLHDVEG